MPVFIERISVMNNISKKAALKFLDAALEQSSHKEIMDAVFCATVLGEDTDEVNAMTHYCRAYNITAYGIEHQFKGILSDFYNEYGPEPVRKAFSQIFLRYPKGLNRDDPPFTDMLDAQLKLNASDDMEKESSHDGVIDLFGAFNHLFKKPKVKTN